MPLLALAELIAACSLILNKRFDPPEITLIALLVFSVGCHIFSMARERGNASAELRMRLNADQEKIKSLKTFLRSLQSLQEAPNEQNMQLCLQNRHVLLDLNAKVPDLETIFSTFVGKIPNGEVREAMELIKSRQIAHREGEVKADKEKDALAAWFRLDRCAGRRISFILVDGLKIKGPLRIGT